MGPLRINKQISNLKFDRAMFTSRGWNCAIWVRKLSGPRRDRGAGGREPRGQRPVARFVPSSTWPTSMVRIGPALVVHARGRTANARLASKGVWICGARSRPAFIERTLPVWPTTIPRARFPTFRRPRQTRGMELPWSSRHRPS